MGPAMALAYCKEYGSRIPDLCSAQNMFVARVLENAIEAAVTEEDFAAIRATEACAKRWIQQSRNPHFVSDNWARGAAEDYFTWFNTMLAQKKAAIPACKILLDDSGCQPEQASRCQTCGEWRSRPCK